VLASVVVFHPQTQFVPTAQELSAAQAAKLVQLYMLCSRWEYVIYSSVIAQ
jgi:hypothetical protein